MSSVELKDNTPENINEEEINTIHKNKAGLIIGSREDVWLGNAQQTAGGLTKDGLMVNNKGYLVSKKRHERGKELIQQVAIKHQKKLEEEKLAAQAKALQELAAPDNNNNIAAAEEQK